MYSSASGRTVVSEVAVSHQADHPANPAQPQAGAAQLTGF